MELDQSGRVALVTGAGRGNGRAIALELAELGADVIVNDLDTEPAESVADEIRDIGSEAVGIAADVSDEDEVAAMVAEGTEVLGDVDILVNNAGIPNGGPFLDVDRTDLREWFQQNLQVHLWGAINCTMETVDPMVEQGYGKIVNITSIHTKNAIGKASQYDIGKFSLLGLTKSLALEFGREGVRVNAVAPGWTNTRMTEETTHREEITSNNPLGRFAEPQEIANAVAFLATPAADYVNGHELRVDGGQVPLKNF